MTTATELTQIRANRVSVQSNDQGGYTAKFHRTHKLVATIESQDTTYLATVGMNKTADREMFRVWVTDNANLWNIQWDPADRRTETNTMPAKYTSDGLLGDSAKLLVTPDVESWVAKLNESHKEHTFLLAGMVLESITPVVEYKGRAVAPKYGNGNWAYATVRISSTTIVDDQEAYGFLDVDLVSGQLKKPSHIGDLGYTYTGFITDMAKDFPFITAKKVTEAKPPVVVTEQVVEANPVGNTPDETLSEATVTEIAEASAEVVAKANRKSRKLGAK